MSLCSTQNKDSDTEDMYWEQFFFLHSPWKKEDFLSLKTIIQKF